MSWPTTLIPPEIATEVAAELLAWMHDIPCSMRLQRWARELNGETDTALAQGALPILGEA